MKPISARRISAIAYKEWIQIRRDPRSLALAFLLPVLLLIFFGYAISLDIDEIRMSLYDGDHSPESRGLIASLEASGAFEIVRYAQTPGEGAATLLNGTATAYLEIPPRFSKDLQAGSARAQLLLDGSDANTATLADAYASAVTAAYGASLATRTVSQSVPSQGRVEARVWYNPTLESRHMIVPGLIAVLMSIVAAMLTSLTIAREWERGTMEQLASTPVREVEVVLGKMGPYLVIGFLDVAITILAGKLLFDTPIRGSLMLLGGMTLLFLVGALGVGMLISATVRSQVLAVQLAMVATQLPAVLLSGFLYDIATLPKLLQGVTLFIPARYFITVTRGIFLKGVGPEVLWIQGLFMAVFAALGLFLATRAFKKKIA